MVVKSLLAEGKKLSSGVEQLRLLGEVAVPSFEEKLAEHSLYPLRPLNLEIFQVNLGKLCNQTCRHCHVDAGPDRREVMTKETMELCLEVLRKNQISTVDITGGAPELNPNFRWFVEELTKMGKKILVRCNLTVILSNKKYHDLPLFFKENKVEVFSSLPHYNVKRTDSQRGEGVFEKSIEALKMLNEVGYGKKDSGLMLNLVYNPSGAFLPGNQEQLEHEFKSALLKNHGVEFNHLFCITNMPISRFLDYLVENENLEAYMNRLVNAFNPQAAKGVMCRNTISVGWDGKMYDCDFNQMLDMEVECGLVSVAEPSHIKDFNFEFLNSREIKLNKHCFGCTAGAGSSCGGEII